VGINAWVAHRNTTIFGLDACKFRPERWLEASDSQLKIMDQNFMPFGLGSRTCIGKNISILEINKLIPVIVSKFDFKIKKGHKECLNGVNRWFVKPNGFLVKVEKISTAGAEAGEKI
jgi:cytochrome P450